ncbi:MAG: response regulator transcription factor [Acidobacteria bacterium]|nr:response regulator transcription factor [Acidobacteriota bacterium]
MAIQILVVDDHEVVREGVKAILRNRQDWEICGEANSGSDAVVKCEKLQPDIVILDITMPGMNGLEAARKILLLAPRSRVVMFTMHDSSATEQAVRRTGAHGLVLKRHAARDLVKAVEIVSHGQTFFES